MRVLVTGHKGYIGTCLTPMLMAEGFDVVGVDIDLFRQCTFSGRIVETPEISKDVRDLVDDDLRGFDAIIHLAGLSNDPLGDYNPQLTNDVNHRASARLGAAARRVGVRRFLFASSCSNYGASGASFLAEEAEFRPVTEYGMSKVLAERALAGLADDSFSPVYLRASTAYGMSPRMRFDLVLNNLTAWAFTTGRVRIKSDGKPWRPVVHVEDICRAYVAALKAPVTAVHNRAFNVGTTSENYQVIELAKLVKEVVPESEIDMDEKPAPDKRCYRVDCNRIARMLPDFKPQWTARRGVRQLYEGFKATGLRLDDFEGERYARIAHVKKLVQKGKLNPDLRWAN